MPSNRERAGRSDVITSARTFTALPRLPADRWTGCLEAYEQDRLGFLLQVRHMYGPLVNFDACSTVVNGLTEAKEVLHRHTDFAILGNFRTQRISATEAANTEQLRHHLNPPLRAAMVSTLGGLTAAEVSAEVRHPAAMGEPFNPLPSLEWAFAKAVATFYFNDSGVAVAKSISRFLDALSAVFGNPFALPASVPTPANLRVRRRYRQARRLVDDGVRRRLHGEPHDDLATHVALAATAAGHSLQQVSNLLIGSLLAGIRVPAAGAAWTLLEITRQPHLAPPDISDAELSAVILEALRLHPPTWLIQRVAVRPVQLAGYEFPAGHNFLISPYVIHRDGAVFPEPEAFKPARWSAGPLPGMLAFGHGMHRCPGQHAGMAMILSALKTLRANYQITAPEGLTVTPNPRTTLVPAGLQLRFEQRAHQSATRTTAMT
jgi:cytochrome P450